jgi:FkbM family methyltransferase
MNIYKFIRTVRSVKLKGFGRLADFLKKILIPRMSPGMVITTIYGFKMKIDPIADIAVERSLYNYGSYEEGTLDVISHIVNEGDTFVDVGANIGLMSLFVAHRLKGNCKVIAFEPNPKTRELLEFNVRLNKLNCVKVESYAIGAEQRKGRIYDQWIAGRGSASLIEPEVVAGSSEIEETSLDLYFALREKISLIKIDIEGYELNALKGAENILKIENPPALIIEYSNETHNYKDPTPIYDFLINLHQYRIFKPKVWKGEIGQLVEINEPSALPKHDNLYCFTEAHLNKIPANIFEKI